MQAEQQVASLTARLKRNPEDVDAYVGRANFLMALDQNQRAIADLEKVSKLPTTSLLLSFLLFCCQAIKLRPDDDRLHYSRGVAALQVEDSDTAITQFSRAIELKPAADLFFSRGMAYSDRNETNRFAAHAIFLPSTCQRLSCAAPPPSKPSGPSKT